MPTTIEDFWQMSLEQGSEIIVELCTEHEPIQVYDNLSLLASHLF